MPLTLFSGIISITLLRHLEDQLILNDYGGQDESHPPLKAYLINRYLIFKKRLQDKNITKNQLEKCSILIDSQIDIAITDSQGIEKLVIFSLGLLAAALTALWSNADFESAFIISAVLIVVFIVIMTIRDSFFPSKAKKLKEMKYFMLLYCQEQI
jgi:hypothetical protein